MENTERKSNHLLTGIITILPIVLFVVIIGWLVNLVLGWVGRITTLFPEKMWDALGLPEVVVNLLGFIILCALVWLLGFVMNQRKMGKKLKSWFSPIISKVPLLNSLSKITNQVTMTLKDTNSFKEVVVVRFPSETTWSIGFITGENVEVFGDMVEENLVSVFIPTTPNPTNGFLVLMNIKDLKKTDVPVATAISFIISMGTAGATKEILKKSYSSL
jgi:uncharacterized membrane protein